MISKRVCRASFAVALLTVACSGGDPSPTTPPGGNPPGSTTARISIQLTTSTPTIWAGAIYGRSGATSANRINFVDSDGRCAAAPASNACFYLVQIGDTVTIAAVDQLADPSIRPYAAVSSPDDPRTIESQFVSWSSPCISRERGVCVFKVTGDQTITAHYKSLSLTRFLFSGLNTWVLTVTAPSTLNLTSRIPPDSGKISTGYGDVGRVGGGPQFPRCIGEAPGVRCIAVLTPDNSTIKMEVYAPAGPAPLGSPGPLNFVGFGGACSGTSACNLTSGSDQTAVAKWEYYRCFPAGGGSSASEGFGGWKLNPGALNGCVLTQ